MIGFAEVEVDVETGSVRVVDDSLASATSATVINPRSLLAQIKGGLNLGIAHALFQKSVVDPAIRRLACADASITTSR